MQYRRVGAPPQLFSNATDGKSAPSQPLIMDTRASPINDSATTKSTHNNVISLPRRYGCSSPPDFDADGTYLTGETRIRDRWFGIPAVDEKVIYESGEVRWHRFRPPPHRMDPIQAASYIVGPAVWLTAVLGLWWLL